MRKERGNVGDPKVFLRELEILVNQQVQYVLGMAARCPIEGDEAWSRVLRRYGVENATSEERAAEVRAAGLSRGAPPSEVRAVLRAIRGLALPALDHIEQQFATSFQRSALLGAWVSRVRRRLETLPHLASSPAEDRPRDVFEPSWPQAAAI